MTALACLVGLLRQEPVWPRSAAWPAVLALANHHLLSPALPQGGPVPQEVADYLALLHDSNARRNAALQRQVSELVQAMNVAGVTPMLLKGSAMLLGGVYADPAVRMIGDLDLMVPPAALTAALAASRKLGYRVTCVYEPGHNAFGELARDSDPAALDLHLAPIDAPHLLSAEELWRDAVALPGIGAVVASPTHRLLHCLLHAQIHHLGGYYGGRIRLSQLYEVVTLARRQPVSWPAIAERYAQHRLSTALHSYLLAAKRLLGFPWPLPQRSGALAELHYRRCVVQLQLPRLDDWALPWGNLRAAFAYHRMRALNAGPPRPVLWRLQHARQFLSTRSLAAAYAKLVRQL